MTGLEKEMRVSADFVTRREIKVCLGCGWPYSTTFKSCPQCHELTHTKTLLIVATWKKVPAHLQTGGHRQARGTSTSNKASPCVRVTNFGNAI